MANAQVARAIAFATQGVVNLVTQDLADRAHRRWGRNDAEAGDLAELPELPELGDLDEVRLGEGIAAAPGAAEALPSDLFATVIGLEHEKAVLRQVWTAAAPLHALLVGPPGSAKSLLMEELRRLPNTRYLVLRGTTATGLRDLLLDSERPRLVLVEEIGVADPATREALRTAMDGNVTKDIHGAHAEVLDVDTRFVAAANEVKGLSDALLSRFVILPLQPYSESERHQVISGFLTARDGVGAEIATEIADLLAPKSGDVRDAEQIAEVWKTDPTLARAMASRL